MIEKPRVRGVDASQLILLVMCKIMTFDHLVNIVYYKNMDGETWFHIVGRIMNKRKVTSLNVGRYFTEF